eukprot:1872452-Amphidinium_carterae.1
MALEGYSRTPAPSGRGMGPSKIHMSRSNFLQMFSQQICQHLELWSEACQTKLLRKKSFLLCVVLRLELWQQAARARFQLKQMEARQKLTDILLQRNTQGVKSQKPDRRDRCCTSRPDTTLHETCKLAVS